MVFRKIGCPPNALSWKPTMKNGLLAWGLAFTTSLAALASELPLAKPEEVGLSAQKLAKVHALLQAAVDKGQTPGVVLQIARHGKVAFVEVVGKANAATGQPMAVDAIFRIHSMTKPITTVAALRLVEAGKIKLEDPVSKYLPAFKTLRVLTGPREETTPAKREMTVRDLMRHTSGLVYGSSTGSPVDKLYAAKGIDGPDHSLAEMVEILGKLPLQDQPGTRFNYSISTDVLARLMEVVAGKPLDELLRQEVLDPLDMRDTGFVVAQENLARFTAVHRPESQGKFRILDDPEKSRYLKKRHYLSGGGGLVSTARDYTRFCQMLLQGGELEGKRILKTETAREMTTDQLPPEALPMKLNGMPVLGTGFGYGLSVRRGFSFVKNDPTVGEFGWNGLASTYFWCNPKQELSVVVLQQVQPYNFSLQISLQMAVYAAVEK